MRNDNMRWPYPRTPSLGRNLPSSSDEGEKEFDRRAKAKFPVGMREADLIEELRSQGFAINSNSIDCKTATKTRGIVFRTLWSVRWRAKSGRIEEVWGVCGFIAP